MSRSMQVIRSAGLSGGIKGRLVIDSRRRIGGFPILIPCNKQQFPSWFIKTRTNSSISNNATSYVSLGISSQSRSYNSGSCNNYKEVKVIETLSAVSGGSRCIRNKKGITTRNSSSEDSRRSLRGLMRETESDLSVLNRDGFGASSTVSANGSNNSQRKLELKVGNFPLLYSSTTNPNPIHPCFSSLLKSQSFLFDNSLNNNNYSPKRRSFSTTTRTTSTSHSPRSRTAQTSTTKPISTTTTDNLESININKATMTVNENYNGGDRNNHSNQEALAGPSGMKPEGVQHNWDFRTYTPQQIEDQCAIVIEQLRQLFDKAAEAEILNFDSVLKPLLEAHRYSFTFGAVVTFPRHVAESQSIRDAASQATKLLDESSVEMSMRKDVFDKLVAYKENFSAQDNLSAEYQRCLDRLIHTGRRNGLHLSEEIRDKVKAIKKQVSELQLRFSRNLGEENTVILFSPEELDGMPATFLEGLEKDSDTGKFKVSLKYPHFFPITRKCRVPETRKTLEIAYQSKCMKENTKILEEVLELRQNEAVLLGYDNHAAYAQDMLMAKNPGNVKTFLTDLAVKLQPLWEAEKAAMLELKKRECEKYNYEYNDKLEMWDFRYYMCLIEEEKYAVDQQLLMGYFPLDVVTQGMLGIYEELLSLKFTPLPDAQKWHDDVQVYQVTDRINSETLGYFYLDLFPRDGKFGHACCVPLQPGCLNKDGVKQPAVSAMLTNFTRPKNNKPSLLDHKEVETYFHEFGHLMHTICSLAKSALLFGTRVETDFLEAPSQMLENWVWEREPLRRMSLHYEMKTSLPDDMIDKLAASQVANAGGLNLRQIVLATFDQRVHLQGRCDTQSLYAQILYEIMGLEAIPDTNMPANFGHLCIGYSGRYYSYLWSEVFSMDMYNTVFKQKGIFNPETGLMYRKSILEPGGSMDAMDMLKTFLGREPNNTAFLESKGLKADVL